MKTVYIITHPEVNIDPNIPVPQWSLSARGRHRMEQMLSQTWVREITVVYSSTERKAVEGGTILASHLALPLLQKEELGEIDRSATGYLPHAEHERLANLFFQYPEQSIEGWEMAQSAQERIVKAVETLLAEDTTSGSIAMITHGAVGALLLCHLAGYPISRKQDQPGKGGGNFFAFSAFSRQILHEWHPIDALL